MNNHPYCTTDVMIEYWQSELKPGQLIGVIWVIQVAFSPDKADLVYFIEYQGLTRILHWIMCVDIGI